MKSPLIWKELTIKEQQQALARPVALQSKQIEDTVEEVFREVSQKGDHALFKYSEKFDGVLLKNLKIDLSEFDTARELCTEKQRAAVDRAISQVTSFHKKQLPSLGTVNERGLREIACETSVGMSCLRRAVPLERVGLYVPGGTAPLPSSVIMQAVPAKLAGCASIALFTPPMKNGPTSIDPLILYAAEQCGISEIYSVGGAQAIAAMTFGTESIPSVAKICGPGNEYVTVAKNRAASIESRVAIDLQAGPSEVLVIADSQARADFVAADLLSQAEHGENSQVVLVSLNSDFFEKVQKEIQTQSELLPRKKQVLGALEQSRFIKASTLDEAMEISNAYAPEHLIINCVNSEKLANKVVNAGSVFIGAWTPESLGDYASGTNHVLPTDGAAKYSSGLGVESFVKFVTLQKATFDALLDLAPTVVELAQSESLAAHANAVHVRTKLNVSSQLMRKGLSDIPVYQSARNISSGSSESKSDSTVFLDANESAFGSSNKSYPDPKGTSLKETLSRFYKINAANLLLTRGADEGIELLIRAFCEPRKEKIQTFGPTYSYYQVAASAQFVGYSEKEWKDLELSESSDSEAKLIFICNPNNPTGKLTPKEKILELAQKVQKQSLVVVDEAYIEFSDSDSLIQMVSETPNLVVLRTLSKSWGLAGLRLGCVAANTAILQALEKVIAPYPLSQLSLEDAEERVSSLLEKVGDERRLDLQIKKTIALRETAKERLLSLAEVKEVYPSATNFLLVQFTKANETFEKLLSKGVRVRNFASRKGLKNCLRITIGSALEMEKLLRILEGNKTEDATLNKANSLQKQNQGNRVGTFSRQTKETKIDVRLDLDPQSVKAKIETGLPFFDHMVEQIAFHSGVSIEVACKGDTEVDDHHTIEDVGIALGKAFKQALGTKVGIERYGFLLPMDESLVQVAIDLSGRAGFFFEGEFKREEIGGIATEMFPHFFLSMANAMEANLHINVKGANTHHKVESCFKGFARSLKQAVQRNGQELASSKGLL